MSMATFIANTKADYPTCEPNGYRLLRIPGLTAWQVAKASDAIDGSEFLCHAGQKRQPLMMDGVGNTFWAIPGWLRDFRESTFTASTA